MTTCFLLKDSYPAPDTYGEIAQKFYLPGGETATAATILSGWGCNIIMDGTNMGNRTYSPIIDFYQDKSVDTSRLYLDKSYDGMEDLVLVDQHSRTPFSTFIDYYTNGLKRWHEPLKEDIIESKVVGLDPWFQDTTQSIVKICRSNNIPYITIDCPYDSMTHKYSTVNILSNEFISSEYPGADPDQLFRDYIDNTQGLVIFTHGAKDITYGRTGEKPRHFKPYQVKVISTLGAGDSFKAGCIYAVLKNMSDDQIVSFAAATAATACTAFPLPLNPPTLKQINELISSN